MSDAAGARIPSSTYRLQLGPDLTFADARALVPYLSALGAGACYLSPILGARPGSSHGYDVVDHTRVNAELGGREAFEALAREARAAGLGVIVDVVPNHMAVDPVSNPRWHDVLENGPSALSAEWFDIDWQPVTGPLHDKVLLPILGDQYGAVLERGELRVVREGGRLRLHYFEHVLPLDPQQMPLALTGAADALRVDPGVDDPEVREFLSVLTALANLPVSSEREAARREERQRETAVAYERLARLLASAPRVAAAVDAALRELNGVAGVPASVDGLHALLERQPYRLAYWRTAFDEINYRRFFDINELGAVRMEDPQVFDEAHRLILEFIREGLITGLRLDHPDGLADPAGYFAALQAAAGAALALGSDLDPCADGRNRDRTVQDLPQRKDQDLTPLFVTPLFVVAEKIVSLGEVFPGDWAIHGGTGYRFLNTVNGLLVDRAGLHKLERLWQRLGGEDQPFDEIAYECRRLIAQTAMASEMNLLAHALERLAKRDRRSRDFTLNSLRKVLREIVASFPVYRTYVSSRGISATDRDVVAAAIAGARRRSPVMERSIFDFVARVLLGVDDTGAPDEARLRFATRFQQFTGPIQAKGLEDTAFYRYVPLISVNEVGSHPAAPAVSVAEFHEVTAARARDWPMTMLALSTHDTKRSADVRARLAVLSERADDWRRTVTAWMRLNARLRMPLAGRPGPDRDDEYHYYQALVGVWPAEPADAPLPVVAPPGLESRVADYMVKAVREAKLRSSWLNPDEAYEEDVRTFITGTLTGAGARRFLARFVPFARSIGEIGAANALAQLVLQIGSPGVPDIYQGSELWQLQLVDPDNRGPVDFRARQAALAALDPWIQRVENGVGGGSVEAEVAALAGAWPDGRIKLWVLAVALRHRRQHPDVFLEGDYVPLAPEPAEAPVVAFARRAGDRTVVVVAARQAARLAGGQWPVGMAWGEAHLALPDAAPGDEWRDRLTGRRLAVAGDGRAALAEVCAVLPVAWLERVRRS
ncbi:MAG: malto-oligosyltrehalose synthase [Vicinamibacterales bacterium]|nr:malto-oligosyltrehalose synthase [Vicinamibacterales bacterium]